MRMLLLFASILLLGSVAQAQIQGGTELMSSTGLAVSSTTNGTERSLGRPRRAFIGRIVGTRTAGAGTLDVTLQHSPVCGTNASWKTLITFTQQNAAGPTTEDVHVNKLNTNVYPCVRAVAVVGAGAGTTWNVNVTLYHDEG